MADGNDKSATATTHSRFTFVPFTSGIILFVYAFFWPDGYGRWLGTIVKAFREVSGI